MCGCPHHSECSTTRMALGGMRAVAPSKALPTSCRKTWNSWFSQIRQSVRLANLSATWSQISILQTSKRLDGWRQMVIQATHCTRSGVWVFVGLGFFPIAIFLWYNFVILKAMKLADRRPSGPAPTASVVRIFSEPGCYLANRTFFEIELFQRPRNTGWSCSISCPRSVKT
jgi:hypothetical protein